MNCAVHTGRSITQLSLGDLEGPALAVIVNVAHDTCTTHSERYYIANTFLDRVVSNILWSTGYCCARPYAGLLNATLSKAVANSIVIVADLRSRPCRCRGERNRWGCT